MTNLVNYSTGIGTISYGSFTFPPGRHYKLSAKPVYDRAERAILYVDYTLEVHAWITADTEDNESLAVEAAREYLTIPGRALTITDIGLGGLPVDGSPVIDLNWGPKPRSVTLAPAGGLLAWELLWTCEFRVSHCVTSAAGVNLVAYNYRVGYSINEEGLTTRQVAGYVEIGQTRAAGGGAAVGRNADQVWEQVRISVPNGFRRIRTDRALSESKNRLEFQVVDEELAGEAFPAGIVAAEVDFELGNIPPGFSRFSASLTGQLTVAKGFPYALAAQKFFLILADRLQKLRTAVGGALNEAAVIPTRIRWGRGLFTRTSRFAVEFTLVGCLTDILNDGGVWEPLGPNAGGDWPAWAASMAQVWHPRGSAKLFHAPGSDAIISICDGLAIPPIDDQSQSDNVNGAPPGILLNCGVTENSSYLAFENKVAYYKGEQWRKHKLAQAFETANPPPTDPFASVGVSVGNYGTGPSARADVIETTGSSEERILMQGKSLRLGFEPAIPTLEAVGGVQVREYQRVTELVPVGNFFGCKLYRARWAILYMLTTPLPPGTKLESAKNKLVCQEG